MHDWNQFVGRYCTLRRMSLPHWGMHGLEHSVEIKLWWNYVFVIWGIITQSLIRVVQLSTLMWHSSISATIRIKNMKFLCDTNPGKTTNLKRTSDYNSGRVCNGGRGDCGKAKNSLFFYSHSPCFQIAASVLSCFGGKGVGKKIYDNGTQIPHNKVPPSSNFPLINDGTGMKWQMLLNL